MGIDELKADLTKTEEQLEIAKSQTYQLIGIQGYLKNKIAEMAKSAEGGGTQ